MKLKITIDNRVYEVEVEASEPEPEAAPTFSLAPSAAPPPSAPVASGSDQVGQSPVAGVVVKVLAKAGETVKTGQTLLVLEAMKMETEITAAHDGVLSKVLVSQGEAVQAGQALYEFEA